MKTVTEYTKKQSKGGNKKYIDKVPVARKITAFSEKEAMKIFQQEMTYEFSANGTSIDTLAHKSVSVDGFDGFQSHTFSGQSNFGYSDVLMKRAKPLKYEFIPSEDRLNKNNGFCVPDVFLGIYAEHIPTLNLKKFTDLCLKVRYNNCGSYEDYLASQKWTLEQGVTPRMLYEICKILDISHYSYSITNKCFLKFVSKNRHYPALVYYCVNEHMYHVENKEAAFKLIMSAKSIEHKIK